jgi:hypothetical protein
MAARCSRVAEQGAAMTRFNEWMMLDNLLEQASVTFRLRRHSGKKRTIMFNGQTATVIGDKTLPYVHAYFDKDGKLKAEFTDKPEAEPRATGG